MKKFLKELEILTLSFAMVIFVLSSNLKIFNEFNTNAVSYRTTYTIYGDLNDDKRIDVFDVIEMRKRVISKDTSKELDLNHDNKVDASDLELLSDYVLGKVYIFDSYFYDDADEDGICDLLEVSLKTNPDSADTDGDTLSDFDEIVYTRTSPTDKYTNGLSITDANDDSDGDKLTNKEELSYGTNPLLSDSDFDDISDYDEVKKYMTDPNDDDSDKDNIIDGDEVKLGLKPNTDKSNGSTLDNQRTFKQNIDISNEILSYINVDDSPYELSIDIVSAGVAEKELSVSVGEFTDYSDNEKIIGKSVALSYNDKLSIDSAKVYFTPRKVEGKISDYMIFEYFPDNNYLLPVETKYTDSSAYVETAELGTFCLVNTKNIMQINNRASGSFVWDYTLGETEVLFFVDISACAEESFEQTKQSIHDFSEALFEHSDNAAVEIIGYKQPTDNLSKFIVKYNDSNNSEVLTNISSVDEVLKKLQIDSQSSVSDLDTALYMLDRNIIKNNIFSSTCENKYVFVTSDSTYALSTKFGYYYDIGKGTRDTLQAIYDSNVKLNVLFSDECMQEKNAISNFSEACAEYEFGVYSKSKTGYFANDTYAKIYSDAVIDLKTVPVMYTCSISPNTIPEKVERNAFINSLPKSIDSSKVPAADADGNIDFKNAAAKVGAKFENLYSACDKSDLTRNGYEQLMENQKKSVSLITGSIQITPFSDKLLYADSDGDTIPDIYDPYPEKAFDERFEIVNDFSYEPSVDFVDEHYKNSQECFDKLNVNDTILEDSYYCSLMIMISYMAYPHDDAVADEIINKFFNMVSGHPMDFEENSNRENEPESLANASIALMHYFDKNGLPFIYSSPKTCELISSSCNNIDHLHRNLSYIMHCSEQTLLDKQLIVFSTKSDSEMKTICFDDKGAEEGGSKCEIQDAENNVTPFHESPGYYCNYVQRDWQNTVGESFGSIVAEVTRNGDTYEMKYKYYFIDIYEWAIHYEKPKTMISELHLFHELGLAKEYLMHGSFEGTITWKSENTAYHPDVASQIENTLKKYQGNESWNKSNEYNRFYSKINGHYNKKYILGV